MKSTFHHAGLVVPDLEKADAFYRQFLNLTESFRLEWDLDNNADVAKVINLENSAAKAVMLEGSNYRLELFEYSAPAQRGNSADDRPCDPGIAHIAFVFEDIREACEKFKAAGGDLHGDPVQLGNTWAIYGRDPFGNIVELMQTGA